MQCALKNHRGEALQAGLYRIRTDCRLEFYRLPSSMLDGLDQKRRVGGVARTVQASFAVKDFEILVAAAFDLYRPGVNLCAESALFPG